MRHFLFVLMTLILGSVSTAQAETCDIERPIMFGGLDWDSAAFHNEVARIILEEGYGCKTDAIPGSTLPLVTGLARGDIDVLMEVWRDNLVEPWTAALERGDVIDLGINFPDAVQGWYVPRYLVEGDAERGIEAAAPDLKSVYDLPRYASLFTDPEEPTKGRFYNCILGWQCELLNNAKLRAYGLDETFTNFRPGAASSLAAAIASAYSRGKPIVAYHWGPTWVLGTFDMVMLEEPPYTREAWEAFSDDPENAPPTAYPTTEVSIGVNTKFAATAPQVIAFLKQYKTTALMASEALAFLEANEGATTRDAAQNFLETRPDVWRQWVSPEIAARIVGERRDVESDSFPAEWRFPIAVWVNDWIEGFVANYGDFFEALGNQVLKLILLMEDGLQALPWWLVLVLAALIGWHATGSVWAPVGFTVALFSIGVLGLWDLAMQTLALTTVSVLLALLIGIPIGVMLAKLPRARRVSLPVLDAMQTLPSFVYLIPALMLFGLGKVPAVFATVIYATPPLIRLTDLGIRLVADEFTEVAADLGAERWQQLVDIEMPLALPNIMAGINQTIMMALSMVVIASMIGARGLGEQVLLGIQRLDVGQGLTAGIAIVALAIVFDRITQAYGKREIKRPSLIQPIRRYFQGQ
jgi:ABC-type proline/glycine betaine transport system permease subunit/ABC-type proline/glycine betaine transport system substrate-binding protein